MYVTFMLTFSIQTLQLFKVIFFKAVYVSQLQDKPNTASLFSPLVIIKIVPLSFKDINEETFCWTL